jgi:hypothetical protein
LEAADYRPPPLVTGAAESGKIITSGKPGPVRSVSRVPVVQALQEFVSCELDFLVALFGRLAAREQGRGDGRASATAARVWLRPGPFHRRVGAAWSSQLMVAGKRVAQDAGSPVLAEKPRPWRAARMSSAR